MNDALRSLSSKSSHHRTVVSGRVRSPQPALPPPALAVLHGLGWLIAAGALDCGLTVLGSGTGGASHPHALAAFSRLAVLLVRLRLLGWLALLLAAALFRLYGADAPGLARWARAGVVLWTAALLVTAATWMAMPANDVFAPWMRGLWGLAAGVLWSVLARGMIESWRQLGSNPRVWPALVRSLGLFCLLLLLGLGMFGGAGLLHRRDVSLAATPPHTWLFAAAVALLWLPLATVPRRAREERAQSPAPRRTYGAPWSLGVAVAAVPLWLGSQRSTVLPVRWFGPVWDAVWLAAIAIAVLSFRNLAAGLAWPSEAAPWRHAATCWWGALLTGSWWISRAAAYAPMAGVTRTVAFPLPLAFGFFSSALILLLIGTQVRATAQTFAGRLAFSLWQGGTALAAILGLAASQGLLHSSPAAVGFALFAAGLQTAAAIAWFVGLGRHLFPPLPTVRIRQTLVGPRVRRRPFAKRVAGLR